MTFSDFSFSTSLQEGLDVMGFKEPTPVQQKAIPIIMEGSDLIACAQTGTGKTAAFVLPVLNKLSYHKHAEQTVNTVIIAPTRELVQQIDQQIEGFSYFTDVSSIAIYGGGDGGAWDQQKKAITSGVDILVATPGRLIALLISDEKCLENVEHLILDEADRMLDMGFSDDIDRILNHIPLTRQTLLFSATMPPKIRKLAEKRMRQPKEVTFSVSKPAAGIDQRVYMAHDTQKNKLLTHLIQEHNFERIIVFAGTKEKVKNIERDLKKLKLNIKAIHSDLDQPQRNEIMNQFKAGRIKTLVGTDIISRGIDVENVDLVVNFDVPGDAEDYVHRIGRTARAATTGIAITFVNDKDIGKFNRIEQLIERRLDKISALPEDLGEGPTYKEFSNSSKGENYKKPFNKNNRNKRPYKSFKPRNNNN